MDRIGTEVSPVDRVSAGPPPFDDFYRAGVGPVVGRSRGLVVPPRRPWLAPGGGPGHRTGDLAALGD